MKKLIWKISKFLLQLLLVVILIIFLARVNYLPVLVPESWKEWIIDTTDKWFEKQGLGKVSEFSQNLLSLKFFDKTAKQNDILIKNQEQNYKNLLNEINGYLNKVTGSFEILLSLSKTDENFNKLRANYYLNSLLQNTSDFNAFHVYDINKQKIIIKIETDDFKTGENVYLNLAKKIEYNKLAQVSSPVVFTRDNNVIIAYAFKGDTLEERGIFFATLSYHFFQRSTALLKGKKFLNYVFIGNKLVYLNKNDKIPEKYKKVHSMALSGEYGEYFNGQRSIMPEMGYRISTRIFSIQNPLFKRERVNFKIGLIYPKNVLISVVLNILLLALVAFGIFVVYRMFFHMRKAYQTYRRLKEAPFILLDDTLNKMSKVFDKMITSSKRIKGNVDKQRNVADKLLDIAPPKAIGYEEKPEQTKKESYGFITEENSTEESSNG
jgi:hypothetical protein